MSVSQCICLQVNVYVNVSSILKAEFSLQGIVLSYCTFRKDMLIAEGVLHAKEKSLGDN